MGAPLNGHRPHLQQAPSSPAPGAEPSPTPQAGCGLGTAQGFTEDSCEVWVGTELWAPGEGGAAAAQLGWGREHIPVSSADWPEGGRRGP